MIQYGVLFLDGNEIHQTYLEHASCYSYIRKADQSPENSRGETETETISTVQMEHRAQNCGRRPRSNLCDTSHIKTRSMDLITYYTLGRPI